LDAHEGLVKDIGAAFLGSMWQQCQTHFMRRAMGAMYDPALTRLDVILT
jgi:transposase-like protein